MPTAFPTSPSRAGFTLVEMSLVLVIIGIILASVMKGRDIISSAQETHEKHVYFTKWITLANDYYKATGENIADGVRNGGNGTMPDGYVDGVYLGTESSSDTRRAAVKSAFQTIGTDPCAVLKGNVYGDTTTPVCNENMNPFAYQLSSEFIGKITTTTGFGSYSIVSDDNRTRQRNFLVFVNVPLDYAKRLDATVDGSVDGTSGSCLNFSQDGQDNQNMYAALPTQGATFSSSPTGSQEELKDWPTDAANRNHLFQVGIMLDY